MKILVTGACGQLGMSIRRVAGEYPCHNFVFTDLPEADITDPAGMRHAIGQVAPQVLINCAAYTNVDRAETEREAAAKLNIEGPKILACLSAEYGFRLVHFSTDYIFDGSSRTPYSETDTPSPLNVYGATKLAGETEIALSGTDALIVRTSWLYSEFGHNFVKTMLRLAADDRRINGDGATANRPAAVDIMAAGPIIRVVDDQTGSPTYAPDLARAVMALLENESLQSPQSSRDSQGLQSPAPLGISAALHSAIHSRCRLYNYCGRGAVTWYGFAKKIFSLAGVSAHITAVSSRDYDSAARRPAYSVLDTSLAESMGLKARPWEEALEETIRLLVSTDHDL